MWLSWHFINAQFATFTEVMAWNATTLHNVQHIDKYVYVCVQVHLLPVDFVKDTSETANHKQKERYKKRDRQTTTTTTTTRFACQATAGISK